MKRLTTPAISAISTMLFGTAVQAQSSPFEDIAALDRQVAEIAVAQPIDTRLKLARCPQKAIILPPVGDAVTVRCYPLGWRILVPVAHGITQSSARDSRVRKGDAVELIINSEGFEVSAQATAIEDGAAGDTVRVKTLTGAVILTGRVKPNGNVEILD